MAAFYQKYRPQRFAEVVGQESIVQTLKNAANAGQLAHAYLFTGSRGVGKTTLARLLAKAANCPNIKDGDPCGKCDVCASIAGGNSLDILEIDAASHTGVDNVREFIEHAQFRPSSMTKKVFIIDEVHMLSKAAFNALLKTLEEPPEHAMFILATTDIEKVPDTIISRTQRFDFKRIPSQQMSDALNEIAKGEKLKFPQGVIDAVVAQSEGSMRDALTRLDMVASLGSKITLEDAQALLGVTPLATVQNLVELIITKQSASLPEFFDTALSGGADAQVFNRTILVYLRHVLNVKLTNAQPSDPLLKNNDLFAQQTSTVALPQLLFVIRLFLRSYKELSSSPSPDLPLLLAAIEGSMFGQVASASQAAQQTAPQQATSQPATQNAVQKESTPEPRVEIKTEKTAKIDVTETEETPQKIHTDQTLEDLLQWWPEVVAKVKTENSPIATLLKNSPVTEVENGRIIISVKYLFHKEHLDNKKHAALILDSIQQVSGKNLQFRAEINRNQPDSTVVTTVDAISDALKVFGGELVE